ncbi:hypothetical protein HNQ34_003439 [Anoxybacillus tepidamans]|uniref:Putative amidase domain-containing protein n=1 Tax=Anoxybacteroides tepidamans TaxID=265948 RepID=A0A7W8IT71_9BACL|nr:amidase domain-containing protein [Anoxybacillus tepidamans]MBB5326305.1 hypothetical protein [Anoxybacillus tepidamans]
MKKQIEALLEKRARLFVSTNRCQEDPNIEKKRQLFQKREAEIVKCVLKGQVLRKQRIGERTDIDYMVHYQFLVRQHGWMYVEEQVEQRRAGFVCGELMEDKNIKVVDTFEEKLRMDREAKKGETINYVYDRMKAVKYAEMWWNSYHPAFPKFDVDCTNFVSQCLYAGGIPMTGYPNRQKGWWMKNKSWSYSWAVAHAFRWYLSGEHLGLQAMEVSAPEQLMLGDVICYDFEGDGRFDHSTIVVAKDRQGMPLVNAHTTNSRMRYWSYEDSSAYTPDIQYKFFHIVDKG